jgi:dTDP-4-amino-4,6-dideoxygalactose transaminase
MNSSHPISISLSPNTEKDDIWLAFRLIFQPWKWKKGRAVKELENQFKKHLGISYAFTFNSGRSCLMAILKILEIKENEEILLQAFTCNAAVNPILKKKAKPVFVDIDETLNLDPEDLKRKITKDSKVVMIQHTFGWPAKIDQILEIVKANNLILIEDCAHSLGARYKEKLCGTFGDIAFFSFGRDKIISSVFGGIVITDNTQLARKIKEFQERIEYPSNFWIFQQLLHPVLMNLLILPTYSILGKFLLFFLQKIRLLSKAVHWKEKRGKIPEYFPKKIPNALAILALNQFKKLKRFNKHRKEISEFYEENLTGFNLPFKKEKEKRKVIFMKYPILTENSDKIIKEAKKRNIILDDGWRKSVVVPPDTSIEEMKYIRASCPKAENIAEHILNLPTHINISKKEAKKILNVLK